MSMRSSDKNFFQLHWDWVAAGAGVLVLSLAVVSNLGEYEPPAMDEYDGDGEAERLAMEPYTTAAERFANPKLIAAVDGATANFLSPGKRIICPNAECGAMIPAAAEACPVCSKSTVAEVQEPATLDYDLDGMPDEYEIANGLDRENAGDAAADKDGDGYTNLEEFKAGTNPGDAKSHPDYLADNRLEIAGAKPDYTELTFVKFCYEKPTKDGKRNVLEFYYPAFKNNYCHGTLSITEGDEIMTTETGKGGKPVELKTGFRLVKYEPKKREVEIAGGTKKTVDASEAIVESLRDKKRIAIPIREGRAKVRKTETSTLLQITVRGINVEQWMAEGDVLDLREKFGVAYVLESIRRDESKEKRITAKFKNMETGETKFMMSK